MVKISELWAICLTNIHGSLKMYLIYALTLAYFAEMFLANSFYLYYSPKISPTKIFPCWCTVLIMWYCTKYFKAFLVSTTNVVVCSCGIPECGHVCISKEFHVVTVSCYFLIKNPTKDTIHNPDTVSSPKEEITYLENQDTLIIRLVSRSPYYTGSM